MRHILFAAMAMADACTVTAEAAENRDSLTVSADVWASVSSNDALRPLLSYSNEWGQYTQYEQGEIGAGVGVKLHHTFRNPSIDFRAGLSMQATNDDRRTMLNELYADFGLWMFDVRTGLENYTPVESNNPKTAVGSYIMSNNARPIPRGWVGILNYWSLPLDKLPFSFADKLADVIQIRGGVSFGLIDDEGEAGYTDDVLLSEKFVYGRIGRWGIKPYLGLNHSVAMGGTLSDGTDVPIDFWNSFWGKHGDIEVFGQEFRGETTNAAGAHQGMWDCGFDLDMDNGLTGKLYYQKPFTDAVGRKFNSRAFDDFALGIQLGFRNTKIVKEVTVEFLRTDWQGGEGLPDPYIPTRNGDMALYWPGDVNSGNIEYLKNNVFVEEDVKKWEAESGHELTARYFYVFCMAMYNKGLDYGGRMKYLYNYTLEQGWTRGGLSMGNALMHTDETVSKYAPAGTMKLTSRMANQGVKAFNFGICGDIIEGKVNYCLRVTYSRNYGNYCEKYADNANLSWTPIENYFFASPRNETYTKLDVDVALPHNLKLRTHLSYDFGELYHSFAFRAGLRYEFGKRW